MQKISIWLLIFLLLTTPLWCVQVTVVVFDKDLGIPLEGVNIQTPNGTTIQTDTNGKALITISDNQVQTRISARLIGYDTKKAWAYPTIPELKILLSLSGVIDSKELVVEQNKPGITDEQSGVSHVISHDEIRNTAQIGIVEDVMSSIKALPGVGYTSNFDAQPSIRGGSPSETRTVLDGVYLLDPYQWGSAYTIFNPNMVDTAKLSAGIISAAYGQVISGLLEVTSRTPNSDEIQFDGGVSTTGLDAWSRIPLGPTAGMILGTKITWMDVSFALVGQSSAFKVVPYIRNGYIKAFWKPSKDLTFDVNSFLGTDGIGIKIDSGNRSLSTTGSFDYQRLTNFESIRLRSLLSNQALLGLSVAWNYKADSGHFLSLVNGTKLFDTDFLTDPDNSGLLSGAINPTGFTLSDLKTEFFSDNNWKTLQGKLTLDVEIAQNQVLSFGAETLFEQTSSHRSLSLWTDNYSNSPPDPGPTFENTTAVINPNDNNSLVSGAYSLLNFNMGNGLLSGEIGIRIDHVALWNADLNLNAAPTINPRLRLNLTPLKNVGAIESLSITGGSGLYAQVPTEANFFEKKYNLDSENLSPTRAIFNLLGVEANIEDGWKISVESYYKYYFNRLYITQNTTTTPQTFGVHTDGTGYTFGVDVLIQRRISRFWDGWLTYSYSLARYNNPVTPDFAGETTIDGDPLNRDFYPTWQRFHTLNLISNWKPLDGFSILLKVAFATGAPKAEKGPLHSYGSIGPGGQVIERFTQSSSYSDTLRTDFSCPIDLKATWSGFFPGSKVGWSFYVGVENILANLYQPKTNKSFDPYYGDEINGSDNADFTIGFPVPSIGFKLSY